MLQDIKSIHILPVSVLHTFGIMFISSLAALNIHGTELGQLVSQYEVGGGGAAFPQFSRTPSGPEPWASLKNDGIFDR